MDLSRAQQKLKELFFAGILRLTPPQPPKLKDTDKDKTPIYNVLEAYEVKERDPLPPFVPWYRIEAQKKEKKRAKEEAKKKKKGIETRKNTQELSISSGRSGSVSWNNSSTNESTTPLTTTTSTTRTSLNTSRPSTSTSRSTSTSDSKSKSDLNSEPTPKFSPQSASMTLTPILPGLMLSTSPSALDRAMLKSHNISTIIMLTVSPPSKKDLETFGALRIEHNHIPLENHAVQDLQKHFGSISDYINANAPRELRTSFSLKDVENRYIIEEDEAERDAAHSRARGHEGTGPSREKGCTSSSNDGEDEGEGGVLLYCDLHDGRSVAITVLVAFIMRQFGVLAGSALKFIETRMGSVELSPHFVKQLDIWIGVQWKVWTFDRMRGRVREPNYEDFLVGTAMALAVDCVDGPFGV
ncbi:dual specificity protein phosphatase family protein [Aspergillus stella-maris]|uniref:dual specificity protein phosphatase family protein n=1 Tax=Aspergillus stella-maris TaxID=1810926 RepID=UPI003CCE144E